MIRHELSFASRMEAINDPWLRDNLTKQLMASYARLDVPAIMEKARRGLCRGLLLGGDECLHRHACTLGLSVLPAVLRAVATYACRPGSKPAFALAGHSRSARVRAAVAEA